MKTQSPERFYVDATVLRLGKWLRLLGVDAPRFSGKSEISPKARLLTRKRPRPGTPDQVVFVPFDRLEEQLAWFADSFPDAMKRKRFGSRCSHCNHLLVSVSREEVQDVVPDYVAQTIDRFKACPRCGKIYWKGSHIDRMNTFLDKVFSSGGNSGSHHGG